MPKIEQYDAPATRLRPSETGVDAFTRAGRYEGQYYRQIAQDTRDLGVVQNQEIRQRGWPFDVLALESEAFKNAGRGVGFKTSGGAKEEDPFGQFSQKPLGRIAGSGRDDPPEYNPIASHGQASRGAAALGRAVSGLGTDGLPSRDSVIDTRTGIDLNNLSPRARQNARAPDGSRGDYTLDQGRFVPVKKDPDAGYNAAADKAAQDWYTSSPYGTDPNTGKGYGQVDTSSGQTFDENGNQQGTLPPPDGPAVGDTPSWYDTAAALPSMFAAGASALTQDARDLSNWISPPSAEGDLTNPENE